MPPALSFLLLPAIDCLSVLPVLFAAAAALTTMTNCKWAPGGEIKEEKGEKVH